MKLGLLIVFLIIGFCSPVRAEWDQSDADVLVGLHYATGDILPQSYEAAVKLFRKAAEEGNAEGQYLLGLAYRNGHGVPKNYNEAIKWLKKSAAQEHPEAQNTLGLFYYTGEGVSQNYQESARWYRKAAMNGNQFSMYSMGFLYSAGLGVSKDYLEGNRWYQKAIDTGGDSTEAARQQLALNQKSIISEQQALEDRKQDSTEKIEKLLEKIEENQRTQSTIQQPSIQPSTPHQKSSITRCNLSYQKPHPYASPSPVMNCTEY
ncbi:MAG: sel1 repeat family protein [Micavibrio sp.]|nr:sel1 repeat family protein [Micavibrio sp.]